MREALARLEPDGLVTTLSRRGSPVVRGVDELFRVRAALEGAAAELVAARITEEELGRPDRLLAPPSGANGRTVRQVLDRNREFHDVIVRASRHERLARLIERTLGEKTRLIAIGYEAGASCRGRGSATRRRQAAGGGDPDGPHLANPGPRAQA